MDDIPTPCPTGKIPHESIESAEAHIRQVEAYDQRRGRTDDRGGLRPYRCPCGKIHVGHKKRRKDRA